MMKVINPKKLTEDFHNKVLKLKKGEVICLDDVEATSILYYLLDDMVTEKKYKVPGEMDNIHADKALPVYARSVNPDADVVVSKLDANMRDWIFDLWWKDFNPYKEKVSWWGKLFGK